MSLTAGAVSQSFALPSAVKSQLHFDGYRRGVLTGQQGGRIGSVEQIWQFRRPTGATAWFASYASANRPGPKSLFNDTYGIGRRSIGYVAKKTDGSGYHFAEGISLEGDMIVLTRVYGTRPVSRQMLDHQVHVQARPVGKGITRTNILSALTHSPHGAKSTTTTVNT